MRIRNEGRDKSKPHLVETATSPSHAIAFRGHDKATCEACSTSSDARCETSMVFKGHEEDPEPLAAAWFRLTGSHTIPLPYALPKARSWASSACRAAMKTSRSALERLGSVTLAIDVDAHTSTSV